MAEIVTGPIRPPSEAYSLLIRVTENCPWNKCQFCSAYKGNKFAIRPVAEVKKDILAARQYADDIINWAKETGSSVTDVARYNNILWLTDEGVKSAFLQDADSLIIKPESIIEIAETLRQTFPELERICTYARGKTLSRKTPEELRRLRAAGISRVHIGLESGDDEILAAIQKGAISADMIEGGKKAMAAGFEVSMYVMPGLGGQEKWEQHVRNTARVLNAVNPHFIRLRSFHILPGTPVFEQAMDGKFTAQTVAGMLVEVRSLIEQLEVTSQVVTSDYAWNYFMGDIDGKLPEDREKLITSFDRSIDFWQRRGEPKRSPFFAGAKRDDD